MTNEQKLALFHLGNRLALAATETSAVIDAGLRDGQSFEEIREQVATKGRASMREIYTQSELSDEALNALVEEKAA